MKSILLTASAIALLAGSAMAQDNLRVGLGVSTLGATLEGAYSINQRLGVRRRSGSAKRRHFQWPDIAA